MFFCFFLLLFLISAIFILREPEAIYNARSMAAVNVVPNYTLKTSTSLLGFCLPFAFARVVWSEHVVSALLPKGLLVVGHAV